MARLESRKLVLLQPGSVWQGIAPQERQAKYQQN